MANHLEWVKTLDDTLPKFLYTLSVPDRVGRFLPCVSGVTQLGKEVALGFSCFAHKLYYSLGMWDELSPIDQREWINIIRSFQKEKANRHRVSNNAFYDPPVIEYLSSQVPYRQRLVRRILGNQNLTRAQRAIVAETKQAIATLAQVGEETMFPYSEFPQTPNELEKYLKQFDWSRPWSSGAHLATLAVFFKTQAHRIMEVGDVMQLVSTIEGFAEKITDKKSGTYFLGNQTDHGELINGAMKVLTALDWINIPVHYPEKLIDTCLAKFPSPEGCHIVDAVYVLYRCVSQTEYRRNEIHKYCLHALGMVKQHHNSDGGFSYYIGKSQPSYYDVPISKGFNESDIHGTVLLTWALSMILEILEDNTLGWRVIKP